jgi:hypothetical protein
MDVNSRPETVSSTPVNGGQSQEEVFQIFRPKLGMEQRARVYNSEPLSVKRDKLK